jgi:hypothetical protein
MNNKKGIGKKSTRDESTMEVELCGVFGAEY